MLTDPIHSKASATVFKDRLLVLPEVVGAAGSLPHHMPK